MGRSIPNMVTSPGQSRAGNGKKSSASFCHGSVTERGYGSRPRVPAKSVSTSRPIPAREIPSTFSNTGKSRVLTLPCLSNPLASAHASAGNVSDLLILGGKSAIVGHKGSASCPWKRKPKEGHDGSRSPKVSALSEWRSGEIRDYHEWQGTFSLSKWRHVWTNVHPRVCLSGARPAGEAPECGEDAQWQWRTRYRP